MLNVLITVDTEVYPLFKDWREDNLGRDIERDIYGETSQGPFGLQYQLEVLNRHRLKASFFVESLFANVVGIEPLERIVSTVQDAGHDVQLHLHPEWLALMQAPPVPPKGREVISDFELHEQTKIIRAGLDNLRTGGARNVTAFRAGDFAANGDTIRGLEENGLVYDSSYNCCYPNSLSDLKDLQFDTQPRRIGGVLEIPVSYWKTWPLGFRHAQLTAASIAELKAALWHAAENDWQTFVIVSHSFEILNDRRRRIEAPRPDMRVIRRFQKLCEFLDGNRAHFRTCGFSDLAVDAEGQRAQKPPLSSPIHRTALRYGEQALRRL
jgi:hypothetical protein